MGAELAGGTTTGLGVCAIVTVGASVGVGVMVDVAGGNVGVFAGAAEATGAVVT